jgi:DNA-binding transcriptional LysR family regulator
MFLFTVRQLEVFLSLCATGNFTETAEHLGISQPAVSRQIRALETQIGFELFLRRPGQLAELSEDGRRFSDEARRFVRSGQLLGASHRDSKEPRLRPIRSYMGLHMLDEFVRPALPEFYGANPEIVLEFLPGRSRDRLLSDIRRGIIDFAVFATVGAVDLPVKEIGTVGSGIYATRDMHIPDTAPETLSMLPFVMPTAGSHEEMLILSMLADLGIRPRNIAARSEHFDVGVSMAAQGHGLAYTFDTFARKTSGSRLVKILEMPSWTRCLYIADAVEKSVARSLEQLVRAGLEARDLAWAN